MSKLAITYDGKTSEGFLRFTCMVNGHLQTYRVMGYTYGRARSLARAYFSQLNHKSA